MLWIGEKYTQRFVDPFSQRNKRRENILLLSVSNFSYQRVNIHNKPIEFFPSWMNNLVKYRDNAKKITDHNYK